MPILPLLPPLLPPPRALNTCPQIGRADTDTGRGGEKRGDEVPSLVQNERDRKGEKEGEWQTRPNRCCREGGRSAAAVQSESSQLLETFF